MFLSEGVADASFGNGKTQSKADFYYLCSGYCAKNILGLLDIPIILYILGFVNNKKPTLLGGLFLLVDDNGLEPLTLRTSSACSTS